jgi:phage terminase Nu1 subunit (DNA packaging protein)
MNKKTGWPKKTGVRDLAKKIGVSAMLVSTKRRQGKSDALIAEEAKRRKAKLTAILLGKEDDAEFEQRTSRQPRTSDDGETEHQAKTRKEIALANLREIEEAKKRGELVSAADVESAWLGITTQIRNSILGVRSRVINRIPIEYRKEVSPVLEDELRQVLTSVSDNVRPSESNRQAA